MGRSPRHDDQVRRANAARRAATKRLIENHREEFRRYLVEASEQFGVQVKPETGLVTRKIASVAQRRRELHRLTAEIRSSGVLDGVSVPPSRDRYAEPLKPIVVMQRMTPAEMREAAAARIPRLPERLPKIPPPPW